MVRPFVCLVIACLLACLFVASAVLFTNQLLIVFGAWAEGGRCCLFLELTE